MKVLFLSPILDPGSGWGRFAQEVINGLTQKGIEAEVLIGSDLKIKEERNFLKRCLKEFLEVKRVRSCLKKNKFDLVHSLEANPYGITAYLASFGLPVKKLISATGAYSVRPLYKFPSSIIFRLAYHNADKILCISRYIESEINRKVNLGNTVVVTLGVDFEKFSGVKKRVPERFILSVGNLSFRKGYHVSISAFAGVAKKIPDIKYYIAGEIKNKAIFDECQKIIEEHHLQGRVVFLGPVAGNDLKNLYLSAELFILTSINQDHHFEGFGLVFLEAAAAGLPVIGTIGNGIEDAIQENKNGLLVPQYDVKATTEAILKILTNVKLKDDFSRTSIEWAKNNTWDRTAKKYLETYKEILKF